MPSNQTQYVSWSMAAQPGSEPNQTTGPTVSTSQQQQSKQAPSTQASTSSTGRSSSSLCLNNERDFVQYCRAWTKSFGPTMTLSNPNFVTGLEGLIHAHTLITVGLQLHSMSNDWDVRVRQWIDQLPNNTSMTGTDLDHVTNALIEEGTKLHVLMSDWKLRTERFGGSFHESPWKSGGDASPAVETPVPGGSKMAVGKKIAVGKKVRAPLKKRAVKTAVSKTVSPTGNEPLKTTGKRKISSDEAAPEDAKVMSKKHKEERPSESTE